MYTYDPNANKQNVDSEHMNSLNEEDLFLAGGFDSFSEANDNLSVGKPYMSGVEQYGVSQEAVNRWTPARVLSFSEQMRTSFNPVSYGKYSSLKISDVKAFILTFCRYYFVFVVIGTLLIMMAESTMNGIPVAALFSVPTLIGYAIVFGICYFILPLSFRIMAWIYRWIARLICLIANKELSSDHLYSVSVYPLIPYQIICSIVNVIGRFSENTPLGMVMSGVSLFMYIVPVIFMAIAIPRMK